MNYKISYVFPPIPNKDAVNAVSESPYIIQLIYLTMLCAEFSKFSEYFPHSWQHNSNTPRAINKR